MQANDTEISMMLKRGDVKLLNKTHSAWYFRVVTYYKRMVDIVVNDSFGKVNCECYYASPCIAANNMEKCRYVKACREFIKRQEESNGRTKQ